MGPRQLLNPGKIQKPLLEGFGEASETETDMPLLISKGISPVRLDVPLAFLLRDRKPSLQSTTELDLERKSAVLLLGSQTSTFRTDKEARY